MTDTMKKHTPGPWRVIRQNDIPTAVMAPHPDLGGYGVCLIVVGPEMEANARLIAAAPALVEALQEAQAALRSERNLVGLHSQIDAALAFVEARP
ncbi:MAG: hypothetical protein WC829_06865 [Hyphomicrobium sp.]|jgi:hypothetical protein